MPSKLLLILLTLAVPASLSAQEQAEGSPQDQAEDKWSLRHRIELRANYRWSDDEHLDRPQPAGAVLATVDPGHHVELNVADIQLDLGYGDLVMARVKAHAQALHRRNPTSNDRQTDIDELFIRVGHKPEFLERPERTSFFVQAGKFPKMERQPVRLLESYGLAATSFNRFEDVQVLVGGTIGRSFYWRAQAANGNPLFMRDSNALAGDNGTPDELAGHPEYGTGFPILYNAETEDLFFDTEHVQLGEAIGYRWQRADESLGFDVIVFHYERELSDTQKLTGTEYGGELDLLTIDEVPNLPRLSLNPTSDEKREYGVRLYSEWHQATAIAQYTKQNVGGLQRDGWEVEAGYRIPFGRWGIEAVQPAARVSGLENRFFGSAAFPAASLRWDWTKYDAGLRVTLPRGLDVTMEYTRHDIKERPELRQREALVTVRWRS
jgi:hypothetical protein